MANYNILKHSDLTKRGGDRVDVFLAKVENGEAFMTKKGDVVISKTHLPMLKEGMKKSGFKTELSGKIKSRKVTLNYPTDFYKSAEFGGKGAGSGTAAEDAYMAAFVKEIENVLVKTKKSYIPLRINGRTVKLAGIYQPKGTPKSDFNLTDPQGNDVGFLSHKAGSKPTDFQQYGGLSDRVFANDKEVKSFMKDCIEMFPNGLGKGQSVYRKVKGRKLQLQSIFGTSYGSGGPGLNNVDEFHQGHMKLTKSGNNYTITSGHKGTNGDIPSKNSGYECILYARYTGDRGANIAGMFLENARVGVFPAAKAAKTAIEI